MGLLPEWLIDGRALLREHFGAALRDVHAVLEADAELTVDGDGGLVAEAHTRDDARFIATHQVGPLVAIQPDPVTRAVRQTRNLVAWPETRVGDHLARGGIHGFAGGAGMGGGQGCVLSSALQVPDLFLTPGWLAEDRRTGDVGLVAFYRASVV